MSEKVVRKRAKLTRLTPACSSSMLSQNVFSKFHKYMENIIFSDINVSVYEVQGNTRYNLTQKVMMNLCVAMAPNMVQTSELDSSRPTASPSNTAWKERASTVKKSLRGFHIQGDGTKCTRLQGGASWWC